MTDGFFWGGINTRQFSRLLFRNFWMVIAVMIITFLGLDLVDQKTFTPDYTSTAVVAVYPMSSSYRYHTIDILSDLSLKTEEISSVFNSTLFQSGLYNQDPALQDCTIDSMQIQNTDLLVLHATSAKPEHALKGIQAALNYYSRFSGDMVGAPEIRILLGPRVPYPVSGGSKIQRYRFALSLFSGLIMAGLFLFLHIARRTFKTEHSIKNRYKNVHFFSLPFIKTESKYKTVIPFKKKAHEPIKKLAIQIKQVLHKKNKKTLLVTSFADKKGGTYILSELARELSEQNENVILIGTEVLQHDNTSETDVSVDGKKYTLQDILQNKCTVKDAMFYSEETKGIYIRCNRENIDENVSYTVDDLKHVLAICLEYADIVLIDGTACYPSKYAQIWQEAADASIALCRQEDADFFKVDQMLSGLQKGDTYFAGCILFGF